MIQHECRCPGCGSCGAAQQEEKLREEIVRLRFAIKALYDKPYVDALRSLADSKNGERIAAEHRAMVAERERDELQARFARAESDERQRIAEWLRTAPRAGGELISIHSSYDLARCADAIEAGEHTGETR